MWQIIIFRAIAMVLLWVAACMSAFNHFLRACGQLALYSSEASFNIYGRASFPHNINVMWCADLCPRERTSTLFSKFFTIFFMLFKSDFFLNTFFIFWFSGFGSHFPSDGRVVFDDMSVSAWTWRGVCFLLYCPHDICAIRCPTDALP